MLTSGACDRNASTRRLEEISSPNEDHRVLLRKRIFTPDPEIAPFLEAGNRHGVLQFFDRQPGAMSQMEKLGIAIHGYQRNDAYYVTIPDHVSEERLREIGVRALFALLPSDKLSASLRSRSSMPSGEVIISYSSEHLVAKWPEYLQS